MAKKITDEKLSLSIVINGNQAQKELLDLEKSTRKLNESQKELRAEKKKLEQQGKKESDRYKEVTAAIKENTQTLNTNKAKMQELQNQIGITGLTMGQLQNKATRLRIVLRNLIPGSADYKRYQAELNQVNARLSELRGKAQAAKMSLGGLADGFNRYQALALSVIASLTGIVLSIQKIIDINGKLSDAQADVMKTTGLAKKEVDELTKSFGLMKTRTARIELLKLAEEGGRLRIEGVENIKSFVNVANQMKVALGDELSDTQIREVGKMVDVYKVGAETGRDFEGAMLSLGSAINEVAATGANQASFLVDFLKRTGGVSRQIRLSAADNIGYAATFDEIGMSQEVTATAMNKLWLEMAKDATEFAKVAEMSVKDFTELFEKDANQAMIAFLKGLDKNSGSATKLMKSLKEIQVGGTRGDNAIMGLAGSLDKLTIKQRIANDSLWEASSLTDEYNVKNENLAATLEKINKTVMGWFSSETFINWLADVVNWFAKLIGATEDTDGTITRFRDKLILLIKIVSVATVSFLSYQGAIKLVNLWTRNAITSQILFNAVNSKGKIVADLLKGSYLLLVAGLNLITLNTKRATAAMRLFNITTRLSPIGVLVGLLTAAVSAFLFFKSKTDETTKSVKYLHSELNVANEIQKEFAKEFGKSSTELKSKVEPLIRILNDQNVSLHTRKAAYEELIKIHPEFIGTVDEEYRATNSLQEAYDKLLEKMAEKMRFEAMQKVLQSHYDKQAESIQKLVQAENELLRLEKENETWRSKRRDRAVNVRITQDLAKQRKAIREAQDELNITEANANLILNYREKQIEELTKQQIKYNENSKEWLEIQEKINLLAGIGNTAKTTKTETSPDIIIPTTETESEKERKKREAEFQKLLEDLKRQKAELLKLEDEAEDERLSRLENGYEKERAILNENHERKLRDLKAQLISEEEIQKAQANSENTNLPIRERAFWLDQKEVWEQRNEAVNRRIVHEEEMLGLNLATIQEKFFTQAIKDLEAQYNREKQARETAYLNEIAEIETLDEAKAKLSAFLSQRELARIKDVDRAKTILRENFQQQELDSQKEFIEKQIGELEKVVSGQDNTLGIDFNILSEEQKNKFLQDIEVLKKAYAELLALKRGNGEQEDSFGQASMSVFGNADVLGFTIDQWNSTFQNLDTLSQKLKATDMIVSGLQNLWGQYNAYVAASENASLRRYEDSLERRKSRLKQQLDQGYINQVQYKNGVQNLEDDIAKKRAELEYKQAKRDRDMAVTDAIVNTARGVTAALGLKFPLSMIIAGLTASMGALQLATIKRQPLPARGYEQGLYPDYIKREQDGKVFRAGYGGRTRSGMVRKPTYFLAGENYKPEMVIDSATYKRLDPELRNALVRQLQGIKGFEGGYYSPETQRIEIPVNNTPSVSNDEMKEFMGRVYEILDRTTSVLEKIEENGIPAIVSSKNWKSIKELRDAVKKMEKVEQKSKIG